MASRFWVETRYRVMQEVGKALAVYATGVRSDKEHLDVMVPVFIGNTNAAMALARVRLDTYLHCECAGGKRIEICSQHVQLMKQWEHKDKRETGVFEEHFKGSRGVRAFLESPALCPECHAALDPFDQEGTLVHCTTMGCRELGKVYKRPSVALERV